MKLILSEFCHRCPACGVFCERPTPNPFPCVPCPKANGDGGWYLNLLGRMGIPDWIATGPFASRKLTLEEAVARVKKVKSEEDKNNDKP